MLDETTSSSIGFLPCRTPRRLKLYARYSPAHGSFSTGSNRSGNLLKLFDVHLLHKRAAVRHGTVPLRPSTGGHITRHPRFSHSKHICIHFLVFPFNATAHSGPCRERASEREARSYATSAPLSHRESVATTHFSAPYLRGVSLSMNMQK